MHIGLIQLRRQILRFNDSYYGVFNRFGGTFNLNSFMLFLTAWKTLKLHTVSVKRFKCQIKRCKIRSGGVILVNCPLDNHCNSPLIKTSERLFEMQKQTPVI